jgi:hypothetical protein
VWKNSGRSAGIFLRNGKTFTNFSTQWNNFGPIFPRYGKLMRIFSTVWKTLRRGDRALKNCWAKSWIFRQGRQKMAPFQNGGDVCWA